MTPAITLIEGGASLLRRVLSMLGRQCHAGVYASDHTAKSYAHREDR